MAMKRFIIVSLALLVIAAVVTFCSAIAPGCFDAFYGKPRALGFWGWFLFLLFVYWDGIAFIHIFREVGKLKDKSWKKRFLWVATNAVIVVLIVGSRIYDEWERSSNEKAFAQECERTMTFPLPRKGAECSKNKYVEFILQEKEQLFREEKADFNNKEFLEILCEAAGILRSDGALAKSKKERVKCWTSSALLYFQCGCYKDSCVYSKKALDCESDVSLAQCIYATSYLYSESAPDNIKVQKDHLIPAILAERDNGFTPHVLNVYMNRLMARIHEGKSKPEELLFMFDLLKEKDFSKNAPYCISNLTERIVQELNLIQKKVETLSRCGNNNLPFLRDNKALEVLDIRSKNFVGLKDILKQLLPHIKIHEKNLGKDLTSADVQQKLKDFDRKEPKLKALIAETKNRISSSCETQDIKGTHRSNQDP